MKTFLTWTGGICLGVGIALIINWPLQQLWNYTIPELFGLPYVTFWQMFRLVLLCGFLFRGGK